MCLLIILSAISLICTSVVINIYLRDSPVPMSPRMYKFVFQWIGRIVMYKHNSQIADEPVEKGQCGSMPSIDATNPETNNDKEVTSDPNETLILEVKKITEKLSDNEQEDCQRFQWKEAARIFDRLFLVAFGFIYFVMILVLFVAV